MDKTSSLSEETAATDHQDKLCICPPAKGKPQLSLCLEELKRLLYLPRGIICQPSIQMSGIQARGQTAVLQVMQLLRGVRPSRNHLIEGIVEGQGVTVSPLVLSVQREGERSKFDTHFAHFHWAASMNTWGVPYLHNPRSAFLCTCLSWYPLLFRGLPDTRSRLGPLG